MFIANSLEYSLGGFDKDTGMWRFDRLPDDSCTKQITYINKAKFIDKANGQVYFLDEEGNQSLTYASKRLLKV